MFSIRSTVAALLLGLASLTPFAQTVPATLNYQGRLTDNSPSQTPISATINMQFEFWDIPAGGTAANRLWQEPLSGSASVEVTGGIFNVLLGASAGGASVPIPASVFSGGTARYLQIIAGGESLAPRQTISATGYANQAQNAALAASATTAITAANATQLGGFPGTSWQRSLSVASCAAGQFFNAIAQSGTAACANAQSSIIPPLTLSGSNALAIISGANAGTGEGVYGENSSTNASIYGVHGKITNAATPNFAVGVYGENLQTGGNGYGIYGKHSGTGTGVNGEANGTFGIGVRGYTYGVSGYGVFGGAQPNSGVNYGVYGTSASATGFGGYFTNGSGGTALYSNGLLQVSTLGAAGATTLCRNASNQIATCSSSLRYKTHLKPFAGGLELLGRLRPISFDWKADGMPDVGFGAEDVAAVDPLFVTYNAQGQVEGVKYDRLTVILINSVREQQTQIEALKAIVCADHPDAGLCAKKH